MSNANTLSITTAGLGSSLPTPNGYSPVPLSPSPSSPNPAAVASVSGGHKYIFISTEAPSTAEQSQLAKMFERVHIYSSILDVNCPTIASLPPFDALWLNVSSGPIHLFMETCLTEIRADKTYWVVAVEPSSIFVDASNLLESLLPHIIIKRVDTKVMDAQIFISQLMKTELPKIKKGLLSVLKRGFSARTAKKT